MRISTITIAVLAALSAGGCNDGAWDAPSPVENAPIVPAEVWDLTSTLTLVTGPACLADGPEVGNTSDHILQVRRDGTAITLLYGDPFDPLTLVGSIDGSAFSAASTRQTGTLLCGDVLVGYEFQAHVAGHFSADGRTFTAKETWSYLLDTGAVLTLFFDWTATRQ